jgi:hypothetical protein
MHPQSVQTNDVSKSFDLNCEEKSPENGAKIRNNYSKAPFHAGFSVKYDGMISPVNVSVLTLYALYDIIFLVRCHDSFYL